MQINLIYVYLYEKLTTFATIFKCGFMNKTVTRFITFAFTILPIIGCDHSKVEPGPNDGASGDVQPDPTPEYLLDVPSASLAGGDIVQDGDTIGVFVVKSGEVYSVDLEAFISEGGGKLAFEYNKPEGIGVGDKIFVYAPFLNDSSSDNPSEVSFLIPAVQKQVGRHFVENHLPRASLPYTAEYALPTGRKVVACTLPLYPLYSLVEFRISYPKPESEGKPMTSVTFLSEGVSGGFQFNLTSGEMEVPKLSGGSVTTELSDIVMPMADGSVLSVYMAVAPGTHSGTLKFKFEGGETDVNLPEVLFKRDSLTIVPVVISAPSHLDPENPTPENPDQEQPEPENPSPEEPQPEQPEPENPTPDQPEPDTPESDQPGQSNGKNETFDPLEDAIW